MKVNDLKEWLNKLSNRYGETDIVFRTIENEDIDVQIAACVIDENENKLYFCTEKSIFNSIIKKFNNI